MVDFDYVRPTRVVQAVALLASHPEAKALSGGQTLIPTLKQRLARPTLLVDLQALTPLRGIEVTADQVSVGAFSRHAETASHPGIALALPALSHLAGGIAHPQVRHMGTMGGSIANNDPAADYPAALMGLAAQVETSQRTLSADEFFTGMFSTALAPSELVVRIRFSRPERAGYCKMPNLASGYVTAGCFIARWPDGQVRVAINGAGPCVFRARELEALLQADFSLKTLERWQLPATGLNSDLHASAEYRAQLVQVAARKALQMALA